MAKRVIYLHGFASGPGSKKASFFGEHLRELGFEFRVPDLAEGNFERLTISGQLRLIERLSDGKPVILIGSSLGGYVAALYAARHEEVEKLILLAPAFQLNQLWKNQLGPERLARWKETGTILVLHYEAGCEMPLGYEFFEDSTRFEPFPNFLQPALLFHGNHDPVVPVHYSAEFVDTRTNVQLIRLDSRHELTNVLDQIWQESQNFLLDGKPENE